MSPPLLSQMLLGGWLLASAFLWAHSDGQFFVAAWAGLLIVLLSLVGIWRQRSDRRIRTVVLWLLFGTLIFPAVTRFQSSTT